ncbi:MAG: hypothetical protein H7338_03655 [Candidatus Sericytochromatia bacterium]|nr:hypothetical protein [Candidatus Sericytochromatia bacterium]
MRNLHNAPVQVSASGRRPDRYWVNAVAYCPACEAVVEFLAGFRSVFCLSCGQPVYQGDAVSTERMTSSVQLDRIRQALSVPDGAAISP